MLVIMPALLKNVRMVRFLYVLIIFCCILFVYLLFAENSLSGWKPKREMSVLSVGRQPSLFNQSRLRVNDKPRPRHVTLPPAWSGKGSERRKYLQELLQCTSVAQSREVLQYNQYWVLLNFLRGTVSQKMNCADSITYIAAGDYTAFATLPELVTRWRGPISFAIYAPGYDMGWTMDALQYARNCLPESELIRQYVTFHMYFPMEHVPPYVPSNEEDIDKWIYTCKIKKAPYDNVDKGDAYRTQYRVGYPINMGRNIARQLANTHFILYGDMDLLPSENLVEQFLDMAAQNAELIVGGEKPRVFALPVFEVNSIATLPRNKEELLELMYSSEAQVQHLHICEVCEDLPGYDSWLLPTSNDKMAVNNVSKAEEIENTWELYYIGDNRVPIYDERFVWEGPSTKRFQGYAMCLLGYEYHMLHPAFLVYRNDSKLYDKDSLQPGVEDFMDSVIRKEIRPDYNILYGFNPACVI